MSLAATTQRVQQLAGGTDSLGATIKFAFESGAIYLDGTGPTGNLISNEDKEAQCTVHISQADFEALLSGELNPMEAMIGGKMRIEGDMGVALRLGGLFG
ncbi:MAG: sterol-binding protein [Bacteroidetes bacterium]|nr:MAG: sterol-binding protein [Bacteroidota bacterium]